MSDWKQAAAERRDVRNTRGEPEVPRHIANKRRNTKDWCRGVVGTPHTSKCMTYDEAKARTPLAGYSPRWRLLVCTTCGKELKYYFPWGKSKPPEWVDR